MPMCGSSPRTTGCAPGNRFIAPTTFPDVHSLEQYAEEHAKVMRQVNGLHFVGFDVLFAKRERVAMWYTAEESHRASRTARSLRPAGRPTGRSVPCSGWRAGSLVEFIKEWNKLAMWEQSSRPVEECLTQQGVGK